MVRVAAPFTSVEAAGEAAASPVSTAQVVAPAVRQAALQGTGGSGPIIVEECLLLIGSRPDKVHLPFEIPELFVFQRRQLAVASKRERPEAETI
jgi:hypothetical protein